MIELKDLTYAYSKKGSPALSGVTATIPAGIHLLAGENGAGKTTLLHIIAGVARPRQGECLIDGIPAYTHALTGGRVFLLEENMYLPMRSIRDFAAIHSQFYPGFSPELFTANLAAFGLSGDEKMRALSLGNRKKAQLAYALALGAEILLLDEPTNALDIESKEILRGMIARNIGMDQTLIVSTHTVTELENLFEGAVILTKSRLLFAGMAEAVTERLDFRVSRLPEEGALYSETQLGRVLSICEPEGSAGETKIDWRMLYMALRSPQRDKILEILCRQ